MDTKTYWLLLLERVVRAFAAGALAALGVGKIPGITQAATLSGVPWLAILTGGVIGALVSLLSSLSSEALPNTLPTSFVPARVMQGTKLTGSKVAALVPVLRPSKHAAQIAVKVRAETKATSTGIAGALEKATPKAPGNPKAQK